MRKTGFLLLVASTVFFSCKKNKMQENEVGNTIKPYENPQIAGAKAYFNNTVLNSNLQFIGTPDQRQKLKKTPDWNRAYIALHEDGDIVTVPLKYERNISFTPYENANKISLDQQSKLLISKKNGNYKVEIVTYIPDKDYVEGRSERFSGTLIVEDWAGNSINTYIFKGNQRFRVIPGSNISSGRLTTDGGCYLIHWFLCDVDIAGNTFNCEYVYTQYVGSCNMGLEPCLEGCGEEYNENLLKAQRQWDVKINTGGWWRIISTEEMQGQKRAGMNANEFTGITHLSDGIMNNTSWTFTWTRFGATVANPAWNTVTSTVSGKVTNPPNIGGEFNVPSTTETWYVGNVFPY